MLRVSSFPRGLFRHVGSHKNIIWNAKDYWLGPKILNNNPLIFEVRCSQPKVYGKELANDATGTSLTPILEWRSPRCQYRGRRFGVPHGWGRWFGLGNKKTWKKKKKRSKTELFPSLCTSFYTRKSCGAFFFRGGVWVIFISLSVGTWVFSQVHG